METQVCASTPAVSPAEGVLTDLYVESGRVGRLDLMDGCYTTFEVFELAARDIVACGDDVAVRSLLRSGVTTVRRLLAERYGVVTGQREYFTPSHLTHNEADCRDFLRVLWRARSRDKANQILNST
jgi:hypothetical protein